MKTAILYLQNGAMFRGRLVGRGGTSVGEMVFNTSLCGYQEIISDPSYAGQIVVFCMPEIGIVGANPQDNEGLTPHLRGVVVRQINDFYSNFRATESLESYLARHGIIGISGIDTRKITKILRDCGAQNAVISSEIFEPEALKNALENAPKIESQNFAEKISTKAPKLHAQGAFDAKIFEFERPRFAGKWGGENGGECGGFARNVGGEGGAGNAENSGESGDGEGRFAGRGFAQGGDKNGFAPSAAQKSAANSAQKPAQNQAQKSPKTPAAPRIAVLDFGVKQNILNDATSAGLLCEVFPSATSAGLLIEKFAQGEIAGVLLSNGPGDPRALKAEICEIQKLIAAKIPMLGICLGHQLLSLAHGFETYKMRFGHHGGNHPVKNLATNAIEITAQNHIYSVPEGIERVAFITHRNLFDGTIEGVRYKDSPIISVQHHPEASPGPKDSRNIFATFAAMVRGESFEGLNLGGGA